MKIVHLSDVPKQAASHEDPVNPGVYKQILLARGDVQSGVLEMLNWATLPAGSTFQSHHHEDMEEVFIMISGTVMMRVGAEEVKITRGDAVVVPIRINHSMTNLTHKPVEYIVFGISRDENGKTVIQYPNYE